ncbi:hypothetical protein FOZ63_031615 [Perkinsus olseni]|uniref:Phytanoyl-CoA dioxygenase n=1 Tax=Perkinsus olseni TaxID=32597 RepID=A0A7J6QF15_PEROL|nr:hypothetical protein FOZ63_031615 [Perkinsus olseni]
MTKCACTKHVCCICSLEFRHHLGPLIDEACSAYLLDDAFCTPGLWFSPESTCPPPASCKLFRQVSLLTGELLTFSSLYATLEQLLCPQQALTLADKFPAIFRGEFDTGVFPDEWHWRAGISKESAPREIVNAWKADDTVAGVVLSRELGSLVKAITSWESVRVAQDDLWWKAPATANSATKGHTDADYFNFFKDNSLLTLWIALDPVGEENSPLQYIEGSHQWPVRRDNEATFHRGSEEAGSILTGGEDVFATCPHQYAGLVRSVSVPRGGCSFHLGNTWHGSPPNKDTKMHRRSLAIHYIPGNNAFDLNVKTGYIYGKYRMSDDDSTLHDCFFPIVG